MTEVVVSKEIAVSAAKVWEKLSSFKGIEEFSPIERSVTQGQGEGAKRTCYMPDGAAIHEVLSRLDAPTMEMEYKILEGPFPIEGYQSTIKVQQLLENRCKVTWGCQFVCDASVEKEMSSLFEGFYHVIIDGLEGLIKNQN